MERIEELLREEFQRSEGTVTAPRDTMLARVAKVRRRRSAAFAGGLAAVLAGLTAVAVAGLDGRSRTEAGTSLPQSVYSVELINVVFTDHDHGFVVQQVCSMDLPAGVPDEIPDGAPTPDVHPECLSQLLVTSDAGRSWQERELPAEPATKDAGVGLDRGHSLMLWVDGPGRVALGGWDRRYWTTTDYGLTWRESPTPREIGPAGSLAVLGPDDRLTFLASYPPGGPDAVGEKNPVVAATDGSFWVACPTGPCVRVTRDEGETWQTRSIPEPAGAVDWFATANGRTVYAAVRDSAGARLMRSLDGGATWAEVSGLTGLPERGADGLALANGDLLMTPATEAGGVYRLKAGATTVKRLVAAPAHPKLYATAGWAVAATGWEQREEPELDSVVSISPDNGTTWIAVPAPPV